MVSVNTASADLAVYRVGERALTRLLTESQFLRQLSGYSVDYVADAMGQPVWQGSVEIDTKPNEDVVTSIPIDEAVPDQKPSIYMTATPTGAQTEDYDDQPTQWFVVSDIGLATFTGNDGLSVFARSLATAAPIEGLSLRLLVRNNEVLGEAVTDAQGRAQFSPGLVRGSDGLAPATVVALNGDEDFAFLDMTRVGFDLSDRGVTGRPAPGPLDVFAWTERGIYRAGEQSTPRLWHAIRRSRSRPIGASIALRWKALWPAGR